MKTNNHDDSNMKKPNSHRVSINENYNVNRAFLYDDIFTVANPNEPTNIELNRSDNNRKGPESAMTNILGNVNLTRETLLPANSFAQREAPITQNYEITDNTNSNNTLNHNLPSIEFNNQNGRKSQKCSIYNPFVFVPLLLVICLIIFAAVASITLAILYAKTPTNQSTTTKDYFSTQNPTRSTSINTHLTSTTQPTTTTTTTTTSTSVQVRQCGIPMVQPNLQQTRIINGFEALPKAWPWVISMGFYGPRSKLSHACGGALINKRFVVTATHCVIERQIYMLVGDPVPGSSDYGSMTNMMRVFVGVTTRSTDITPNNTYRAIKIESYPNFDGSSFQNDLTIVKLDRDVEEDDFTSFICLKRNTETSPGKDVYAIGWGFTESSFYRASDKLMQVKLPIKTFDSCGLTYIPVIQFCAGNENLRKDTCNGDSGGPIMQMIDNAWTLVGVVSNGDAMCTGKGIYTNISHYMDWIYEKTRL